MRYLILILCISLCAYCEEPPPKRAADVRKSEGRAKLAQAIAETRAALDRYREAGLSPQEKSARYALYRAAQVRATLICKEYELYAPGQLLAVPSDSSK